MYQFNLNYTILFSYKSANKVQTEKQKALELGQISVKYGVREI